MSYTRRRNPLGIVITGYGFAGPSQVARRGFRGFGGGPYFYGLGFDPMASSGASFATAPAGSTAMLAFSTSPYQTNDLVPSTAEIEMKRAQELAKLAVEAESMTRYPETEAKTAQAAMDRQIAQELTAQQLVNTRGEPLYPEKASLMRPVNEDLLKAQQAEKVAYEYAQKALAQQELKPPTSDDPKLWMAYEQALARKAGTIRPTSEPTLPVQKEAVPPGGPMPLEAPPAAKAAAAAESVGAGVPAGATSQVQTQLPLAPAAGGSSALLLGGAALALFFLLR